MKMTDRLWAIIPAAGQGIRAKTAVPKQFMRFGGRSVLERTLFKVVSLPDVEGVIVALPPAYLKDPALGQGAIDRDALPFNKPVLTVMGGATRQDSVYNALRAVPAEAGWIMVHDASRPFFSQELFYRVFDAAKVFSAAICGFEAVETVKTLVRPLEFGYTTGFTGFVGTTLNRKELLLVQTPQIFRKDILVSAYEAAIECGYHGTDDSQLVERLGYRVAVVEGERTNIKITFPEDFMIAETFLRRTGTSEFTPSTSRDTGLGFLEDFRQPRKSRSLRLAGFLPVTGFGFDIHPLVPGRKCILGGVEIPFERGLLGHSDGDVLCHATMDAILGALGLGDIGKWFPPDDPRYEGACSLMLMAELWQSLKVRAEITHVDCTLIAEVPRIAPYVEAMKNNFSRALHIDVSKVSIKATTPERLGALGREEGIAGFCAVSLLKKGRFSHGAQSL
ncbi:MAG: 2-C-methyl-D-erythritol 4-phosphate cytidylyltransferase [Candidatus Fermentithermobacillus carboniphilus]|uniref:Bifunctional enzyme IspD/IspF n=1 Tax=Candidatus Fermentithermobacillus carboniphilus TaxID=3085328 RepID=A0AAT9LAU3_9FIRM|nr:MAG: 2-C-methyl-D-erythritol 4-phosphate cytidylyltransferase [Candidatus Fermentithermobacillus carboniphilus]